MRDLWCKKPRKEKAKLKTVKELSELLKKTPEEVIDILDGIGIKKKSAYSLITLEDREKMRKVVSKRETSGLDSQARKWLKERKKAEEEKGNLKTVKELSELLKKTPEEVIDILDGIGIKKKSAYSLITLEDKQKMWKVLSKNN